MHRGYGRVASKLWQRVRPCLRDGLVRHRKKNYQLQSKLCTRVSFFFCFLGLIWPARGRTSRLGLRSCFCAQLQGGRRALQRFVPCLVKLPPDGCCKQVASARLLSWGDNSKGQLGVGHLQESHEPPGPCVACLASHDWTATLNARSASSSRLTLSRACPAAFVMQASAVHPASGIRCWQPFAGCSCWRFALVSPRFGWAVSSASCSALTHSQSEPRAMILHFPILFCYMFRGKSTAGEEKVAR